MIVALRWGNIFISVVVGFLISSQANALGKDGYEALCMVAYEYAEKKTQSVIKRSFRAAFPKKDPVDAFARLCAQGIIEHTPEQEGFFKHSQFIDRSVRLPKTVECISGDECLSQEIGRVRRGLLKAKSEARLPSAKQLGMMGHLIGDLHQPMHIAFRDDLGGRKIGVNAEVSCNSFYKVWADCLTKFYMAEYSLKSSKDLADDINRWPYDNGIAPDLRIEWSYDSDILSGLQNTYKITIKPSVAYCLWKEGLCSDGRQVMGGDMAGSKDTNYDLDLGEPYFKSQSSRLMVRIRKGSIFLALLFDELYAE